MKKNKYFILLILVSMLSFRSLAQEKVYEDGLISRFRPGFMWFNTGLRPAETERVRKYDRLIIDIHYNTWAGDSVQMFQNNWSSISSSIQWMFDVPLQKYNTVSFGWGLGYKRTHIRFDEFLVRNVDLQATSLAENNGISYDKTHFFTNELFIPLELRIRSKGWKHVKFHVGGQVGYRFNASTRYHSTGTELQTSTTTSGFYDLNPLNIKAHARVGIRNWALFAAYDLLPYFRSKESTQLKGFSCGLSISLF